VCSARRQVRPHEEPAFEPTSVEGVPMSREIVSAFFAALESGDIEAIREIYAPDIVVWHNYDQVEQDLEQSLKVLKAFRRTVSDVRYEIIRQADTGDGVLQQHILHGRLSDGRNIAIPAAIYLQVRDGRITRIEEYLDPSPLMSPREAG